MKSFLEGIQYLFEQILFAPMNFFRFLELESWWWANFVNWIFTIICIIAMVHWLKQLRIFKENNEDDQDTTAHSFLK
jgi:bacteriorhodopsin